MLTNNADVDRCKYSGYGIGFDFRTDISLPGGSMWEKSHLFVADSSSSVHIDNKGEDTLILGEGPTQGLDDSTLTAEAIYSINFTQSKKKNYVKVGLSPYKTFFIYLLQ